MKTFNYLGSTLAEDVEPDEEVICRVHCGLNFWNIMYGVLWDIKMNAKIKRKVFRTLVRPAGVTRHRHGQ